MKKQLVETTEKFMHFSTVWLHPVSRRILHRRFYKHLITLFRERAIFWSRSCFLLCRCKKISPQGFTWLYRQIWVVSEQNAREMAEKVRRLTKTDYSLSTTATSDPMSLRERTRIDLCCSQHKRETAAKELRLKGPGRKTGKKRLFCHCNSYSYRRKTRTRQPKNAIMIGIYARKALEQLLCERFPYSHNMHIFILTDQIAIQMHILHSEFLMYICLTSFLYKYVFRSYDILLIMTEKPPKHIRDEIGSWSTPELPQLPVLCSWFAGYIRRRVRRLYFH